MISVCMATYNGAKFIKEQIDSILCQLSIDDELIISDDGSTDGTLDIINSCNDSRIKVFQHNAVDGSAFIKATRNFENAMSHASGDYIFLSDQDDVWFPNKVELCVQRLKTAVCVKSQLEILGGENVKVPVKNVSKTLIGNIVSLPFRGCCMAFRRELLEQVLPIPKSVIVHDGWIGCMAHLMGGCEMIETPLVYYRVHNTNVSIGRSKNSRYFQLKYRFAIFVELIKRRCFGKK